MPPTLLITAPLSRDARGPYCCDQYWESWAIAGLAAASDPPTAISVNAVFGNLRE